MRNRLGQRYVQGNDPCLGLAARRLNGNRIDTCHLREAMDKGVRVVAPRGRVPVSEHAFGELCPTRGDFLERILRGDFISPVAFA